jgi:iron complex outermembrane receptor protein
MVEKILSRSVRLMFVGGVVIGAGLMSQIASAQEVTQRVEITGSSIKRIAKEGALPVQTLSRSDIDQSGATSVADLVASMPSMQGMITSSASVNGGGAGLQTASVHAIGTAYTLVLLNGRRMAPYGSGSAVNLASIPLSAVERVEILTDGASTLYGSDAIAGVINFILKKNQTDLNIELTGNVPQDAGGKSFNVAISKGFGNLETDGFNVQLAYSHDEQKALESSQRKFSKSGVQKFVQDGKEVAIYQVSRNSSPANVDLYNANLPADDQNFAFFSPDLVSTGKCNAPNTFARGGVCRYDYPATVQLTPQLTRDSIFASASMKLGKETTIFGEAVFSRFTNQARFAPAAQPLTVFSTDPVTKVKTINPNYIGAYNKTVVPLLSSKDVGVDPNDVTTALFNYRGADAGGRTDDYKTDATHLVIGIDSNFAGWDYNATYTHSENTQKDNAVAGYMSANTFDALVKSGAYDPFIINPNGKAVLAPAVLHENLLVSKSKIDVLSAHGSKELFAMTGGMASLGLGIDMTKQQYSDAPSKIAMGPGPGNPGFDDTVIGGTTGLQALDASRTNWGTFGELLMPVMKNMDITAAIRYDSYAAVKKNNVSYDVDGNASLPGTQGEPVAKATYKLSGRFQPVDKVLLRASYGTGFKAPTLNNISDPLKNGGSSSSFPCPITNASDPRFLYCRGTQEYALLTNGNPAKGAAALKAEESNQMAMGIRFEPTNTVSLGFDWWDVKLKNQIQALSQDQVYTNPVLADKYISIYYDPIQKSKVLVGTLSPVNLATSHYQGIDWDTTFRTAGSLGKFSANWTGTYMIKAEQDVPGVGTEKSVGRFDSYDNVVFRVISRLVLSLKSSDQFTNSLTFNYRSGYHDKVLTADDGQLRSVNADGTLGGYIGMERDVASYSTMDYQLKANLMKNLTLTGGIKNLLNQDPPLSVRNTGGGNQVGYDGRYTDPIGRMFYITAGYKY